MELQQAVLATVAYFDVFNYPITFLEIFQFLPQAKNQKDLSKSLDDMVNEGSLFQIEEYYSLRNDPALISLRKHRNQKARQLLKTADKAADILYHFPFVKGVGISGSLSKNCADENADIDFFLIIEKNRLWFTRTLLHLFKKLTFLVKKEHCFCMNYLVDEEGLEIEEKNIYTATETITVLPFRGQKAFEQFYAQNQWANKFLPNHILRVSHLNERKSYPFKKVIEWFFRNQIFKMMEKPLMKVTAKRWADKTIKGEKNSKGIALSLKATMHCCKPDPAHLHDKILSLYDQKLLNVFQGHGSFMEIKDLQM